MTTLGIIAGFLLPLFNIPLIVRIIQRRSSADISLVWTIGVWLCIVGMLPGSLVSTDPMLKVLEVMSVIFFSGVLAAVLYFHPAVRKKKD